MADREEVDIDISALRQRLRDEYAFVNKQKRDLQKDYNTIVSTGDSLLRGLWIAGQQWRNLNRLRGGSKFASECAYTSSLLDSIQFQDGYATIGFKEVKYGNFLRDVRENTEILKSILILADKFNIDTSAFLRTIITSLYGSCLFPVDEKCVLTIVKGIIQYHLVYSEKPLTIFSKDGNSFVNILDVLFHTSLPCRAFLVLACREVVFDILLDGSLYWTLEEQELLSVMAVQEVRKRFGEPGSPGTTERIKDHMMRCWVALADTVYALFKKINSSLVCLPDSLIWIVSCFYKSSLKRGFNDGKARQLVMRFFINQVIVPLLSHPQPFIIDTEIRASRVAKFNLKKVTLIIQTLVSIEAGDDMSYLSSEARQFYENLDKAPLHEIVNNLVEQLPKHGDVTLSDKDSMPGIARTSVLITKTDLDSLVNLFCQLKYVSSQPQRRKLEQIINHGSLEKLLKNLEGTHFVTSTLAKMSFSTQDTDVENELHNTLQAFDKSIQENEIVLVISLGVPTIECPGMLQEEKVLGMPTPKTRRKSTIQEAMADHISNEINENSQPSDSDSNDSSSDEKLPESEDTAATHLEMKNDEKPEDVDSADDALSDLGFVDSFVPTKPLPPKHPPTNPFAQTVDPSMPSKPTATNPQSVDPFSDFDSVTPNVDQNDPFTRVITRLPEQPAPIHQVPGNPSEQASSEIPPSGLRPSTNSVSLTPSHQSPVNRNSFSPPNNQGPLIDLGGELESPSSTDPRSSSSTSGVMSDDLLFSSGSHSSNESGKRFSSSASSSSDSGVKMSAKIPPIKKEQNAHINKKEKKGNRDDVRRKSLKENIQNVISNTVTSPKRDKKKGRSTTLFTKKRRTKKNAERLIDSNDVATFIASVEKVKTPKVICDEIMHKYAAIKKDRPHKSQSNVTMETAQSARDEEEIERIKDEKNMKDAKNKLRLVLSNGSAPVFPVCSPAGKSEKAGRALLAYLKQDLADAITFENCTMVARLYETLSTLEKLSPTRYPQVLNELQQDYLSRKAYLSYLVRAHQGLVATRQYLEKALERVDREREICRRYLMTQCVSMFIVNQKEKLDTFVAKFDKLPMADEKSEEMKSFIQGIKEAFQQSPLWLGSNDRQKEEAFDAVERQAISRVYWTAVYAFGETDKFRDDVFHESVKSLCSSIGEEFDLLEIKEDFQNEAPWFPAQYELYALSAYKTPKDKLKCIQRCCTTIMSLLGMSSGDAVGADAFTPVLIYVVMHANPRGLLTTIDFINNYLNETLSGEQYYCWMQFCSAIQFIKILLEENKSMLSQL